MDIQTAIVIVSVIAFPIIFVLVFAWIKSAEKREHNEMIADLYRKSLETGQPIPPSLLEPKNKNKSLRTGIILVSIGIGLSLFLSLNGESQDVLKNMSAGLIPLFLGIGFLIIHFIWKKKGYTDEE